MIKDDKIKQMNFLFPNNNFSANPALILIFLPLIIWSFAMKGFALWHAVQEDEKYWFMAILILNTFGILEIFYLFVFAKNKIGVNSLLKKINIGKH